MFPDALDLLRCSTCQASLELEAREREGPDVTTGQLVCTSCAARVPIESGIPRFVSPENYASTFGFQWGRFAELQVDSLQGGTMTADRFFLETGLDPADLKDMRVLEAGCGGGRFSDVVLEADARLWAVDLSNAVDKNRELHRGNPRLHLIQSSILDLPLLSGTFDLVFCFGVLQHTPDPAATFRALVPFVKPGGLLAVDIYAAHPKQILHWKYVLRPFTRRMSDQRLMAFVRWLTSNLLPVARALRRVPIVGKTLTRLVPLKVHDGILGQRPPEKEEELAVLETFDALSPAYDRPRSRRTVQRWFQEAGFQRIEIRSLMHGLNYGRGVKAV
jgi:2-polyprenyl-3-methyl-5-hydroxy-6-metoxy-1,4-benzoquinol methylase